MKIRLADRHPAFLVSVSVHFYGVFNNSTARRFFRYASDTVRVFRVSPSL